MPDPVPEIVNDDDLAYGNLTGNTGERQPGTAMTKSNQRLRLLFCDNLSMPRGKYLPYVEGEDGSSGFCRSLYGVQYDRDLVDAPGAMMMEGLPDFEARYRASDVRDGWEKNTRVVIADLLDHHGIPLALDGRNILRRAISAWNDVGLEPLVGIELECFAFVTNESGQIQPYGTPGAVVYGTGGYTDPLGFTHAIWDKACEIGMDMEVMTAEYDTPQFEFTLKYDKAMRAVDDVFLFRLMAREIALEYGVLLTFIPKPLPSAGGSGMHINLSFTDKEGRNAIGIADSEGGEPPNELARKCLSGLMRHHRGLAGLLAPTANSYARLQPAALAGYWQNWAIDHRGVTARITRAFGPAARIEHRMADCTANPYIAVAAVLQAAMLGYTSRYSLQDQETRDCMERQDANIGVAIDLRRSMRDLDSDQELKKAVGEEMVANLIFMKNREFRKTKDLEGDELRDFYIHFI